MTQLGKKKNLKSLPKENSQSLISLNPFHFRVLSALPVGVKHHKNLIHHLDLCCDKFISGLLFCLLIFTTNQM